jgi:hypothetical protein
MVHLDLLEPPGDFDIDDSLPLSVSSFVPPLYSTLVGFSPGKGLFDIPQAQKTSIASTSSSDINRDLNVPSGSVKPFSLFDQVSATSGASQPKSMFGSDVFGRTRSSSSSHQPSFSIPSALATNSQSHEEAKSPTLAARKEERRVPAKAHPPEAKITMLNTLIPLVGTFLSPCPQSFSSGSFIRVSWTWKKEMQKSSMFWNLSTFCHLQVSTTTVVQM